MPPPLTFPLQPLAAGGRAPITMTPCEQPLGFKYDPLPVEFKFDSSAHGMEGCRTDDEGGSLGRGDCHVGFGAEETAVVFGEGVEWVGAVGVGDGDVAG